MNPGRSNDGYCTANFRFREMVGCWHHVNYVESLWSESVRHDDSWANIHTSVSKQIFDWCDVHVQGEWAESGGEFYFDHESDAFMFSIAWLGREC